MGGAYYNEIDPLAAATLRELITEGVIAPGVVDERSIEDVRPDELAGYTQCHFFAGGGIWSYALRRAGWPDDKPIWTGSCPCQPFSTAGKGLGFADERHLWPAWDWLIQQCRPEYVAGEQVADKSADAWLDLVQADMEAMDYAFGCVPLASAGFGAPNMRHRSFWLAYSARIGREGFSGGRQDGAPEYSGTDWMGHALRHGAQPIAEYGNHAKSALIGEYGRVSRASAPIGDAGATSRMANADDAERRADNSGRHDSDGEDAGRPQGASDTGKRDGALGLADTSLLGHERSGVARGRGYGSSDGGDAVGLAHALCAGWTERRAIAGDGQATGRCGASNRDPGPTNGFWRDADWLFCRDPGGPRWRPVDAGTFPLAPGYPARVGGLRISGNAINAEVATGFIEAVIAHLTAAETAHSHPSQNTESQITNRSSFDHVGEDA